MHPARDQIFLSRDFPNLFASIFSQEHFAPSPWLSLRQLAFRSCFLQTAFFRLANRRFSLFFHVLLILEAWAKRCHASVTRRQHLPRTTRENHSKNRQKCQLLERTIVFFKLDEFGFGSELVVSYSMVFPIWLYFNLLRSTQASTRG